MNNKVFCITGMHRSGTSLIANWFYDSGIFIGFDLLEPASTNIKGHFEDNEILNIHRDDLIRKGMDASGYFVDHYKLEPDKSLEPRIKEFLASRKDISLWGWKEPRTTLYLNYWKNKIPDLKVIIMRRNLEEVIQSLYTRLRRNKWYYTRNPFRKITWYLDIDLKPGKWRRKFRQTYSMYEKAIIEFEEQFDEDLLIIYLDELIRSPELVKKDIKQFLGVELSISSWKAVFSPGMIHNHSKLN